MKRWNILYRGSLTSCNYSCDYCPFAKTSNTRSELQKDAAEVERFVGWVEQARNPIGVLFTPWGEAIIHSYYRDALVRLSRIRNVQRVSMQTNLSGDLEDLARADAETLALWATFHPGEVALERFVESCEQLSSMGIAYSVGVVGLKEHFDQIDQLRSRLATNVYLWVNAYKCEPNYYSTDDITRLRGVDPYFDLNLHFYASAGKRCHAGETTFVVNGAGDMSPCHFIEERIGNIYLDNVPDLLRPRRCTKETCECHIGYVHQPELELYQLFGDNVLERIPRAWPHVESDFTVDSSA